MVVELTKELIERVAQSVEQELALDMRSPVHAISPAMVGLKVKRLLELESQPLHTFTFDVRGDTRVQAVQRLDQAGRRGELFIRTDITLRDDS